MSKTKQTYCWEVLSPDGIPIEMDSNYKTLDEALEAFHNWLKRYEHQGYYSFLMTKIPLIDVMELCTFQKIPL